MSRYLDAMRTRLEKIRDKLHPLQQEEQDLIEAISIFEKKEAAVTLPAGDVITPATKEPSTAAVPTFLHKK